MAPSDGAAPWGSLRPREEGGLWDVGGAHRGAVRPVGADLSGAGIVLISIFAVNLDVLPAGRMEGFASYVLPAVTLGLFGLHAGRRGTAPARLHARRAGQRVRQVRAHQGAGGIGGDLEARPQECADPGGNVRRVLLRHPLGRQRGSGDRICLAGYRSPGFRGGAVARLSRHPGRGPCWCPRSFWRPISWWISFTPTSTPVFAMPSADIRYHRGRRPSPVRRAPVPTGC